MADETPALAEPPKTLFDKVIATTPIVLTIIATIFAGLSSTEMNLAMYWRSVAAQDQAKATSQWSLAGFKRDRSLIVKGQAAALLAVAGRGASSTEAVLKALPSAKDRETGAAWLMGSGPPKPELPALSEPIQSVQKALAERLPEDEVMRRGAQVNRATVDETIRAAEAVADSFDKLCEPVLKAADEIEQAAMRADNEDRGPALVVQAARAEIDRRRYLQEAKLNQGIGRLYEVRVAVTTAESDRHRVKSKNFFYVMLVAQAGVTVASVAMAQRQKSLFWMLASIAGVVAILFGVYVYLAI